MSRLWISGRECWSISETREGNIARFITAQTSVPVPEIHAGVTDASDSNSPTTRFEPSTDFYAGLAIARRYFICTCRRKIFALPSHYPHSG
jgi:hypothetical protein